VRELIRRVFRGVRGGEPGAARIRLVTSRYLGAKRFLTLVEVDGERLLLGLAGDQVSLVARLNGPRDGAGDGGEKDATDRRGTSGERA